MAHPAYESEFEEEFEGEMEDEFEGEDEGEFEDEFELEAEGEFEEEYEAEGEFEEEISPVRKIYSDAMMEHLGALAAEAESEEEAVERFLPLIGMAASKLLPMAARALAPMARKALPRMVRAVTRVSPQLTRGVGKIARTLYRQPGTRTLVRAMPSIARRTIHSIARQASHGRPVTSRMALRTLARQTQRVLKNPRMRHHVLRRHRHMDSRFHNRWGRGHIHPHWRHRRYGHGHQPGYTGNGAGYSYPQIGSYQQGGVVPGGATYPGHGGAVHPSCPSCGGSTPGASPNYCRCCGQVLR